MHNQSGLNHLAKPEYRSRERIITVPCESVKQFLKNPRRVSGPEEKGLVFEGRIAYLEEADPER
jgi:hypothetical protein